MYLRNFLPTELFLYMHQNPIKNYLQCCRQRPLFNKLVGCKIESYLLVSQSYKGFLNHYMSEKILF